jgi:hypothetical protein
MVLPILVIESVLPLFFQIEGLEARFEVVGYPLFT